MDTVISFFKRKMTDGILAVLVFYLFLQTCYLCASSYTVQYLYGVYWDTNQQLFSLSIIFLFNLFGLLNVRN